MFEPFDIMKEKRNPAPLGQLGDRPFQIDSRQGPIGGLAPSGMRNVERFGALVHSVSTAAQVIETVVHSQTVQPRAERRAPLEGRQFAVHEQKDLL
jgi:hypothetical protein